ncbi:nitrite extrusion protein 2 (plasmid) [Klebsiella pneumoniae subsp. pneumoniae]|nr:nitrite extrusion protein 2 [Klebsiella pneumoniae]ARV43349.1 nitrite extrusion protein 2 [Klebsiella pneumoniae subsp. pneumoniae]
MRRLRFSGPKTSIIRTPTTSLKTSIKTITNLSYTNCLEIHGASLLSLGAMSPVKYRQHLGITT